MMRCLLNAPKKNIFSNQAARSQLLSFLDIDPKTATPLSPTVAGQWRTLLCGWTQSQFYSLFSGFSHHCANPVVVILWHTCVADCYHRKL